MSTPLQNPFPGLRSFGEEEDYLFFGREEQTVELVSLLRKHRFLAVVGTSGSGKSSLVRAGLLPALHGGTMAKAGTTWEVVVMKPGGAPIENLAQSLIEADFYDAEDEESQLRLEATLTRSRQGLVEAIKQSDADPAANVLVVVDQFEEIFRFRQQGLSAQEAAGAFIDLLLHASEQTECNLFVALTMRSDYLGDCAQIPGLAEAVNDGEYLIPRLRRQQRRDAIEKPVQVSGATIAERLVQRLLNDVGDDADQLPVLQHALMRTWDVWFEDHQEDEPIDLRHYGAAGGMESSLSLHADSVFDALPDDAHRAVATRLFKTLTERTTDNREIRRPKKLSELIAIVGGDSSRVRSVIDAYRRPGITFLMPGSEIEVGDETVIDISHESLMRVWGRLRQWVDEEAQSASIYHRLWETSQLWKEGKAGLYHDPDLSIAQAWREENQPNAAWAQLCGGGFETASEFLDKSHEEAARVEREREEARQRELAQAKALADSQARTATLLKRFAVTVGAAAVLAIGLAAWAMRESREAQDQRALAEAKTVEAEDAKAVAEESAVEARHAQGRTWVANARALSEDKNSLGARLKALRALGFADSGRAQMTAAQQDAYPLLLQESRPGWQEARNLASTSIGIDLFWQSGALAQHPGPINSIDLSPGGRYLASTSEGEAKVRIWDAASGELRRVLDASVSDNEVVGFSHPDGRYLALAGDDEIEFWEVADGEFRPVGAGVIKAPVPEEQVSIDAAESGEGGVAVDNSPPDIRSMVFYPDGKTLVLGDDEGRLYLWENWPSFKDLPGKPSVSGVHSGRIVDLALQPGSGSFLASVSRDDPFVSILDASTLEVVGQLAAEPFTRGDQTPHMRSVSFSADGKLVAAGGSFMPVTVWDVATWQVTSTLLQKEWSFLTEESVNGKPERLNFRCNGVAFSNQGALLAVGWGQAGNDNDPQKYEPTVTVYDLEESPARPVQELLVEQNVVGHLGFAHGDRHLVMGHGSGQTGHGGGGRLELWDLEENQYVSYRAGAHRDYIDDLQFSRDGTLFASADRVGVIRIWEARTGNLRHTIHAHEGQVIAICFSADGRRLFSIGHTDKRLCAWNTETGAEAHSPIPIDHRLVSLELSPNGESLVLGGWSQHFHLYDPHTLEPQHTLTAAHGNSLIITPDARQAIVHRNRSGDPEMLIYELGDRQLTSPTVVELWSDREVAANITGVALSPDGLSMAVGFNNGTVKVWRRQEDHSWVRMSTFRMPDGARSARVTFDARGRLITGDDSGRVHIWNLPAGGTPELLHVLPGSDPVADLKTSPDGSLLLTGSMNGILQLWSISNEERVVDRIEGVGTQDAEHWVMKGAFSIALARERRLLFTASRGDSDHPNAIVAWRIQNGRLAPAFLLEGHSHPVGELALSSDERYLASGELPLEGPSGEYSILLWDLETREFRRIGDFPLPNLEFSPDGKTLAGARLQGPEREAPTPVYFWDVAKGGGPVAETQPFKNDVFGMAFTPNGKQILIADSEEGQPLRLFDIDPDTRQTTLAETFPAGGGRLTGIAFGQETSFFASASTWDERCLLWDLASRTPRGSGATIDLGPDWGDWAFSTAVSPDGSLVAMGGGNSKVVVVRGDGSGDVVARFQGSSGIVNLASDLEFDADNRTLVMSFMDGNVVVWRLPLVRGIVEPTRYLEVLNLGEPSEDLQFDLKNRHLGPPDGARKFGEIGNTYLPFLAGEPSSSEARLSLFDHYVSEGLFHSAHATLLSMDLDQSSDLWGKLSLAITESLTRAESSGDVNVAGPEWHLAQSIFEEHPPSLEIELILLVRNRAWDQLAELLRERLPELAPAERLRNWEIVADRLDESVQSLLDQPGLLAEDNPNLPTHELLFATALYRSAIQFKGAWETDPWTADAAFDESSPAAELLDRLAAGARDILVAAGGEWKYFDEFGAPDPIWNRMGYDDRAWAVDKSPLGFTEDVAQEEFFGAQLRRALHTKVAREAGETPQLSYYFRKEFKTPADWEASLLQLTASFICDDGLVLYLDGEEVLRYNLPEGDLGPDTEALTTIGGDDEETALERVLPPVALRPGEHLLAAEVHQAGTNSSDLLFDLALYVPAESGWRSVQSLESAVAFLTALDPQYEVFPWLVSFAGENVEAPLDAEFHSAFRARILGALGAKEEALAIADRRIAELADSYQPVQVGKRKLWLRWKADLLRRYGYPPEEVKAVQHAYEAIPPRDPSLDPKLVDLTNYYTRSFYLGPNATAIPETFVPRHEISYDLRGIIELNSGPLNDGATVAEKRSNLGVEVPDKVEGVAIRQKAATLHFLLNAEWGEESEPIEVGKFIIHYDDGSTAERPLIMGEDVAGWWGDGNAPPLPDEKVGWRNPRPRPTTSLAEMTWKNPHPDKTIESLDFISALKRAAPFLVAITLE